MRKWLNIVSSLQCRRTAQYWVGVNVSETKPSCRINYIHLFSLRCNYHIFIRSKSTEILLKGTTIWSLNVTVSVTWPHHKKTPTGWWLTTSSLSGTSNSKDLAQIMRWNTFLNRNYEALSMWLDYKATIVMPHSEMNSSFICTFSSNMETTSLLLSHSATSSQFWLHPLLNSQTSP